MGRRGASVTAYERADRGGFVWLRWGWQGGKPKQKATEIKLRRPDGSIDPLAESEALGALALVEAALAAGRDPLEVMRQPEETPKVEGPPPELTLRQGCDLALDVKSNRAYYTVEGEPWRQARTYSNDLCEILGGNTLWRTITTDTAKEVWRTYADWHNAGATRTVKQGNGTQTFAKGGHDTARRTVWWLYVVAKIVARIENRMPPEPPRNQKELLAGIWLEKTGESTDPVADRFTDKEVAAMLAKLPEADPRLRLALGLALETRLGQAIRGKWSHLDLSEDAGAMGHGVLEIFGRRKKRGTLIDLSADQRAEVDRALAPGGVLGALEQARKDGRFRDYPLFPGGRLPEDGVARADTTISWTSTGLRGAFLALEKAAGVTNKPGRALYGFRRWAADRAEDFESDERALNHITSHAHTRTRRGYQEAERMAARRAAAEVRAKLRAEPVKKPTKKG